MKSCVFEALPVRGDLQIQNGCPTQGRGSADLPRARPVEAKCRRTRSQPCLRSARWACMRGRWCTHARGR